MKNGNHARTQVASRVAGIANSLGHSLAGWGLSAVPGLCPFCLEDKPPNIAFEGRKGCAHLFTHGKPGWRLNVFLWNYGISFFTWHNPA
jgi:hypothetical protein